MNKGDKHDTYLNGFVPFVLYSYSHSLQLILILTLTLTLTLTLQLGELGARLCDAAPSRA